MVKPLWKIVWWFLTKLNILLPYGPTTAHLGIYPKEPKAYVHTKNDALMFIVPLFIITNT